jgi:hypothetical protein
LKQEPPSLIRLDTPAALSAMKISNTGNSSTAAAYLIWLTYLENIRPSFKQMG